MIELLSFSIILYFAIAIFIFVSLMTKSFSLHIVDKKTKEPQKFDNHTYNFMCIVYSIAWIYFAIISIISYLNEEEN